MDLTGLLNWQNQSFSQNSGSQAYDWLNSQKDNRFNFKGLNSTNSNIAAQGNFKIDPKSGVQSKNPFALNNTSSSSSFGMSGGSSSGGIGGLLSSIGSNTSASSTPGTNDTTQQLNSAYDTIANGVSSIPGIGTIVGGIMKVGGMASDALNSVTNGATTIENATLGSDKVLSSKFLSLTPMGLANALSKTKVAGYDTGLASSVNRGYSATVGPGDTEIGGVSRKLNKLFTGKDAVKDRQSQVNRANRDNALKSNAGFLAGRNEMASANAMQDVANKNRQQLVGGQRTNVLAAKKGTKLAILKSIKERVVGKMPKPELENKNVIPSGALHARKNNLPEDIAKEVTHKGIPVISKDDGGKIKQHAEIENSEIIFNKKVTNQLEDLLKKFNNNDENAAIEAGKLLTYEILENTEDNVGLLEKI